jgi:hypothetical protein
LVTYDLGPIDTPALFSPIPISLPFYRVHPLKRASSSYVYSQCAVHIVVGPCAKGHFIRARSKDPEFFFFFSKFQPLLESFQLASIVLIFCHLYKSYLHLNDIKVINLPTKSIDDVSKSIGYFCIQRGPICRK